MFLLSKRDAATLVCYGDFEITIAWLGTNSYLATRRRSFDSIAEQITQYLHQPEFIRYHSVLCLASIYNYLFAFYEITHIAYS